MTPTTDITASDVAYELFQSGSWRAWYQGDLHVHHGASYGSLVGYGLTPDSAFAALQKCLATAEVVTPTRHCGRDCPAYWPYD